MYLAMPFSDRKAEVCISLAAAGDMGANTEPHLAHREAFFKASGLPDPEQYPLVLEQVHSHVIYDAEELAGHGSAADAQGLLQGDGIISRVPRALGVSVADCVPIFLRDTRTGAVGAFHSGWKGTGIAAEGALRMAEEYGCRLQDMEALIGPAIGGCCYRVEQERYDYFLKSFGPAGVTCTKTKDGEIIYSLDLKLINFELLSKLNLKKVIKSEACTCCDTRFFSFRRAMAEGAHFSRMLAYIKILE